MPETTRVAYLITSYTLPGQVLRLAQTLRAGSAEAWIVVHHDDRRCRLDRPALDALGARFVEPPSRVAWGEPSQLTMVLRCLRWLLERTDFGWVVLLSGQDYPIRPIAEIEASLATVPADALIEAQPVRRPRWGSATVDEFARRQHYRQRRVPGVPGYAASRLARARPVQVRAMPSGTWIRVPALRSPFGPDLVCHRGSDWFTLSRRAVEVVDRVARERPDLLRHYRRTLIPTEAFVQTVLANRSSLRLDGDIRRFTLWDAASPGPRIPRMGDLERIVDSGGDFARKFDETVDGAVLDEINRRVHTT